MGPSRIKMPCFSILQQRGELKLDFYALCIGVISAFALCFINRAHLTNTVYFGGDHWEYQSLAVNRVYGHGYQVGAAEAFALYRFADREDLRQAVTLIQGRQENLYTYFNSGSRYSFFRSPGYPFFLAAVYKLLGVNPLFVRYVQILLLGGSSAILVLLSVYYWGGIGRYSGALASLLFVKAMGFTPAQILTESLLVFGLSVWALIFVSWERSGREGVAALVGFMSGVLFLIKGGTLFIPLFALGALLLRKDAGMRVRLRSFLLFLLGAGCALTPWDVYTNSKQVNFFREQYARQLLDCNNEDSVKSGSWEPSWQNEKRKEYFYNRPQARDSSALGEVVTYFSLHPSQLIPLLVKKWKGFLMNPDMSSRWIYWLSLGGMFAYFGGRWLFALRGKLNSGVFVPIFPVMFFLNSFLISTIFYANTRFLVIYIGAFCMVSTYAMVAVCQSFWQVVYTKLLPHAPGGLSSKKACP